MSWFRKSLYHGVGTLNKLLLFILPAIFAVSIIASSTASANRALEVSRVYDNLVPIIIENYRQNSDSEVLKQLLAIPEVRSAIEQSFPPEQVRANSEAALQGVVDWIQGKSDHITFRIDLTNARANLSDKIAIYIQAKLDSLPVCNFAQLRAQSNATNLLDLVCQPPGIDTQSTVRTYVAQLLNSSGLLANPVITGEMLPRDNQGRTIEQQFHNLPAQYRLLNIGKWVVLGLVVLLSLALIFGRKNRRHGLRHLAWELVGVGLILVVIIIGYKLGAGRSGVLNVDVYNSQLAWNNGINSILSDVGKIILLFSGTYLLLGISALLSIKFTKPKLPATPSDLLQ